MAEGSEGSEEEISFLTQYSKLNLLLSAGGLPSGFPLELNAGFSLRL